MTAWHLPTSIAPTTSEACLISSWFRRSWYELSQFASAEVSTTDSWEPHKYVFLVPSLWPPGALLQPFRKQQCIPLLQFLSFFQLYAFIFPIFSENQNVSCCNIEDVEDDIFSVLFHSTCSCAILSVIWNTVSTCCISKTSICIYRSLTLLSSVFVKDFTPSVMEMSWTVDVIGVACPTQAASASLPLLNSNGSGTFFSIFSGSMDSSSS